MKRALVGLAVLALTLSYAQVAWAQQTGNIDGTISDPDGAPLPGAMVTLSGEPIMGTRVDYTGAAGNFRFPGLPPGFYTVAFDMDGFRSVVREEIRVALGTTTSLQVTMELAAVEETITVTGQSPIVDVRSSSVTVNYSQEMIKNIPTARNWADIVFQIPGVSIGFYTERFNFSTHGSSVRENEVSIDGVANTDPVVGYSSSQMAYESMEEIQVITASHKAEYGSVSGAYVNIVTKSGGNSFHGEGNFYYENEGLQSDNLTPELEEQGLSQPSKITKFQDYSFNVGGPIVRDKLWFYTSLRKWDTANILDGFPALDPSTGTQDAPIDAAVNKHYIFVKGTYQVHPNHKLLAMYNRNGDHTPHRGASRFNTADGTFDSDEFVNVYKGQWTAVLSDNAYLEANFARSARHWCLCYQSTSFNTYWDRGARVNYGGNYLQRINDRIRNQANGSLSYFVDDWGGTHDWKFGVEWERSPFNWDLETFNNVYEHRLTNGVPLWAHYATTPMVSKEVNGALNFYAQDSWNIGGRVTLNLGARLSHWTGGYPAQSFAGNQWFAPRDVPDHVEAINWTSLAPRFGLTWDVSGDGVTAVRVGVNRYHWKLISQYYDISNPNSLGGAIAFWTDLNGDGTATPNEVGSPIAQWGGTGGSVDPDLKHPYTDEFTAGIERELFTDFSLGANFIWKKDHDLIEDINIGVDYDNDYVPVQVTDPGPDGVLGTADDKPQTIFNQINNLGNDQFHITNPGDDRAFREYKGFEVIGTKRMSNNWQMIGSIVYNNAEGTLTNNYFGGSTGRSGAFDSPNNDINRGGPLSLDQTWQVKLSGTYQFPYNFNVSGYYRYLSGYPTYRSWEVRGVVNQTSPFIVADPWDTWRKDGYNLIDFRVEWAWQMDQRGTTLGLIFDAFNLLNENTVTSVDNATRFGTFNDPLAILPPRIVRLGARLIF